MIEEIPTPTSKDSSLEQAAAAGQRLSFGERQRRRAELERLAPDFTPTRPGKTVVKTGEVVLDAALSPILSSQIGEVKDASRTPEGVTRLLPGDVDTSAPLSPLLAEQVSTADAADLNMGVKPFAASEQREKVMAALGSPAHEPQATTGSTPISPLVKLGILRREAIDPRNVTPTDPHVSTS